MPKKTLRSLVAGAHKNSISVQHRISREDAERIRTAENRGGHDRGLRVVPESLREETRRRKT